MLVCWWRKAGVIQLRGDITRSDTICRIRQLLNCSTSDGGGSEPYADVIVCDGAADVTGVHDLDSHLGLDLVLAALGSPTLPPTLPIFPSPPSYGLACIQSLHFLGRCVRFSGRIKVPGVPCAATLPHIKTHACLPTALTCVLIPYWRNFGVWCCVCVLSVWSCVGQARAANFSDPTAHSSQSVSCQTMPRAPEAPGSLRSHIPYATMQCGRMRCG